MTADLKRRTFFVSLLLLLSLLIILSIPRHSVPKPKNRDLSGGATIQRKRIDNFIDSTARISFDGAVEELNKNGEIFAMIVLAGLSSSSPDRSFLNQVRADRRVSKIYQHLKSLPATTASDQAVKIFDAKLKLLEETWHLAASKKAFNHELMEKVGPDHHAASAALFLCSLFCSSDITNQKMREWDRVMDTPDYDHIQEVSALRSNRRLDPIFRLNLLIICGYRKGASIGELKLRLASLSKMITGTEEPILNIEMVRLYNWDAETLDTDFTHVVRGVPASGKSTLVEFPGLPDCNVSYCLHDQQSFDAVETLINGWQREGGTD